MSEESIDEPASSEHVAYDEGLAAFEYASNLDSNDREGEAIPIYRQALTYGLPSEVEYRALVQLGSSLRVVNGVEAAVATHRHVTERWPDRPANRIFLALALLDADQPRAAAIEALTAALLPQGETDLDGYRRALTAYSDRARCTG